MWNSKKDEKVIGNVVIRVFHDKEIWHIWQFWSFTAQNKFHQKYTHLTSPHLNAKVLKRIKHRQWKLSPLRKYNVTWHAGS